MRSPGILVTSLALKMAAGRLYRRVLPVRISRCTRTV